ncbi:MAG: hypothetical protein MR383_03125 [Lachnospiraceae bacterium]|nr:hypothetical protein [Lachnospiraceae bacterium]MDD7025585.1 hypothetical protein [Lachnospiraceae bacterium]MDY5701213.1 hypothetical protein [Lachnospiraceae bacterium]
MRIWFKVFQDNHLLMDTTIENCSDDSRTHKVLDALAECCYTFNLSQPIWLESTIKDFQRHARARFTPDAFVEEVDFDYLEIHVIEED